MQLCLSTEHKGVGVVTEIVTPTASSNPVLVAFVVLGEVTKSSGAKVSAVLKGMTRGLEDRLAASLPAYMIPGAYIPIEKIPLRATGKTDRRRLREIRGLMTLKQLAELNPLRGERREPSTDIERRLRSIEAIGVYFAR